MEILERYEHDYRIAQEKGARPELMSKMEEQIAKLSARSSEEDKGNERFAPEDIFFPDQEEEPQGELKLDDQEEVAGEQSSDDDFFPSF